MGLGAHLGAGLEGLARDGAAFTMIDGGTYDADKAYKARIDSNHDKFCLDMSRAAPFYLIKPNIASFTEIYHCTSALASLVYAPH